LPKHVLTISCQRASSLGQEYSFPPFLRH
jgi:hypothetical protein